MMFTSQSLSGPGLGTCACVTTPCNCQDTVTTTATTTGSPEPAIAIDPGPGYPNPEPCAFYQGWDYTTGKCTTTPLSLLASPGRLIAKLFESRWPQEAQVIGMGGAVLLYIGLTFYAFSLISKKSGRG